MVNLFDFSKNQSTVPNATGYLSKFTPKPAQVLNFGAPMSGTTQFSESWIKQAPKPTAPTSGGFSLVPKANAMEEQEDLLQIYLKDPKQDNNSKKELFKALQDWESPDNLIKYLQDSWYKWMQPTQQKPWLFSQLWTAAKESLPNPMNILEVWGNVAKWFEKNITWAVNIAASPFWVAPMRTPSETIMGVEKATPSLLERSVTTVWQRGQELWEIITAEWQTQPETVFQWTMKVARGLLDIWWDAFMSGLSTASTQEQKDFVKQELQKAIETKGWQYVMQKMQEAQRDMETLRELDPRAARNFEAVFTALEWAWEAVWLWTGTKTLKATWKATTKALDNIPWQVMQWAENIVDTTKWALDATKKLLPKTDVEKIDLETTDLIRKAVRPSTTWVDTDPKFIAQSQKLLQWVKEVVNQWFKPKDAKEAMEAINKTKQNIWAKVQQGNQQVTKTTNWNEIWSDIYKFLNDSDNDAIFRANPELETRLIKYAEEVAGNRRFQNLTQDQLQELLTDVNSKIPSTAFLKQLDTNPIETQKNAVLAIILRDKLENNLMETIGTNNQALRNSYWAVRQLEKDLARRYWVYARQNPEWLADMFWIDAIPEMIMWVLRWDIGWVVWGLAKRTLIWKLKQANNPNNIIKDIFKKQSKIKNLPSKPSSNVRTNPNNTPIINSNKPLQNNQTTVKPRVLSDKEKALIQSNKSKPLIQSPLSERERKLLKAPVKTQLETTLKWATTSNINEITQSVAKTLKTTKTAEIKAIIQRYLKEFWKDFKNKIGDMIEEIANKVWAKLNLVSDKQGIWADKTALLKGSDDLISEAKKYKTFEEFIQSQWETLYHTTTNENLQSILKEWFQLNKWKWVGSKITEWIFFAKWKDTLKRNAFNTNETTMIEAMLDKGTKIKKYDTDTDFFMELIQDKRFSAFWAKNSKERANMALEILKEKWYEAIEKPYWDWFEIIVLYPDKIKTKSQLRQIYEQAKKSN